ncbi:MAG: hypothetical protein QXQ57_04270 [Sulfolobales archaeon]
MISFYGLLKMIHLTCFAAWSALTLGGYIVLRSSPSCEAVKSYLRLVYLEAVSAVGLYASGVSMASIIGWPSWAYISSIIVLPLGFIEALHLIVAYRSANTCVVSVLFRLISFLTPVFTAYYLLMLYIMVFKPF